MEAFVHFDRQQDLIAGTLTVAVRSWDRIDSIATYNAPVLLLVYFIISSLIRISAMNFYFVQDVIPNKPIWAIQLTKLFNDTNCSRETCFVTTSFIDTNGQAAAPDNYIYLTSFPNVRNMQLATVQVIKKSTSRRFFILS